MLGSKMTGQVFRGWTKEFIMDASGAQEIIKEHELLGTLWNSRLTPLDFA